MYKSRYALYYNNPSSNGVIHILGGKSTFYPNIYEYLDEVQGCDNFVKYIQDLLSFIEALMTLPQATDKDKQALDQIKLLLHGKEAQGIEQELAAGIVRQDTFDRIEKLDKNLTDLAVEQMTVAPLVKEFLKRLTYYQIEQNKREAVMKLNDLRIGVNK